MRLALCLVAGLAGVVTLVHQAREARACGGCFAPPETITTVDSHRMVISLSVDKTILWDQIRYSGNPEDFVWVLPVPSATVDIAIAEARFFDELEAQTAPVLIPPPLPPPPSCPPAPDGWGGAGGGLDASAGAPDAAVDVYSEEVVGPYQTVVLGSSDATALLDWLNEHGYKVPAETLPVVNHYIDGGSKFVVLRLAPDQGVEAMQPVRIEYPGYMATFPLKMVTVGAWGTLELTLWVIAEQRYAAVNYGTVTINRDELVWDFASNRSNYNALFRATIDAFGGKAWVAEFAAPMSSIWFDDYTEVQHGTAGIRYPYLTRLRTDQLLEHLAEDLRLGPSAEAGDLSRWIQIDRGVNQPPPPQCPDYDGDGRPDTWADYERDRNRGLFGCRAATGAGSGAVILVLAVGLALRRMRRNPARGRAG